MTIKMKQISKYLCNQTLASKKIQINLPNISQSLTTSHQIKPRNKKNNRMTIRNLFKIWIGKMMLYRMIKLKKTPC